MTIDSKRIQTQTIIYFSLLSSMALYTRVQSLIYICLPVVLLLILEIGKKIYWRLALSSFFYLPLFFWIVVNFEKFGSYIKYGFFDSNLKNLDLAFFYIDAFKPLFQDLWFLILVFVGVVIINLNNLKKKVCFTKILILYNLVFSGADWVNLLSFNTQQTI